MEIQLLEGINVISIKHLDRLLGGELLATGPRLSWSKLMRRTFAIDVLRCPRCHGRMRPIAEITDGAVLRRILDHLDSKEVEAEPARSRAQTRAPP